jgi:uroporphyrin-3 C-methyltransferase
MSDKQDEQKAEGKSTGPASPAAGEKAKDKEPDKAKRAKGATPTSKPSGSRRSSPLPILLSLLALVVALATAGAGAWLYRDLQGLQSERGELTERLQRLDEQLQGRPTRAAVDELRASLAGLRDKLENARGQIDQNTVGIEQSLARVTQRLDRILAEQDMLSQAVENTREIMGRDQTAWMLAEVEHLLRIANHRVRLENDFAGGIQALKGADERLRELGDPAALPIRSAIAEEIAQLENVERPDLAGIALRLQTTAEQVHALGPGRPTTGPAASESVIPEPPEDPTTLAGKAWRWLTSLVSLTREKTASDQPPRPGITRARQTIEADLAFARSALLDHDTDAYRRHLGSALETLNEAFDIEEPRAARLAGNLKSLKEARLSPELPDLGDSLAALRSYQARRAEPRSPDTGTPGPSGESAEPEAAAEPE